MGAVGKKLRSIASEHGSGRKGFVHWCPGCEEPHAIYTSGNGPLWTFDGNIESPTFSPSIRCFTTEPDGAERTLCHYNLIVGKLHFCGDSPHALANQVVELPDWPYAPGEYGGIDDGEQMES